VIGSRRWPAAPLLGALLLVVGTSACGPGGDAPATASLDAAGSAVGGEESTAAAGAEGDGEGERSAARTVAVETEPVRPVIEIPTEWPSEIEELYGRYWLYWQAFAAAHGPPGADSTYGPLRELSSPVNWTSLEDQLRSFAADGLVLELPEDSITEHLLRIPNASVLAGDEGDEVILQDCWIDDFVRRTVDGDVVAEAHEAKLMNVVMKVIDGEWRVHGVSRATPESDGYQQCVELIDQR